jgi:hypothetical protein
VTKARALRALVNEGLPRRQLRVSRVSLINGIVSEIEHWRIAIREIEPLSRARREKVRELDKLAKRLLRTHLAADAKLRELGAEKELASELERLRRLGIESPFPMGGAPPAANLRVIVAGALAGLGHWQRLWEPKKGRPRKLSGDLVNSLKFMCQDAGCTNEECENLFAALSGTEGLPVLRIATLKRRDERARKRRNKMR